MVKKYLTILIIAFTILGLTASAYCYQAEVVDISGKKYFPAVKEVLSKAQKSIYLVMYFVQFDPKVKKSPVSELVEELVSAHNRGVKVKVILDQNVIWGNKGEIKRRDDKNETLFMHLKKLGIEVYYDNLFTVTHSKAIVIDEETVILGSANWTESSLRNNREASCKAQSKELAKEFLADFAEIAIDYEASILDEERAPAVRLSDSFLKDSVSQALGLDQRFSYVSASDILREALMRLDKRYKLIKRIARYKKGPHCLLLNYDGSQPYLVPREGYSAIPDEYWQYGWNKRLSLPEQYFFLINLRKSAVSRGRLWTDYRAGIMDEFNIKRNTLIKGMMGLRKLNIIEIEYPSYSDEGFFMHRGPMGFRFLGLYSPEVLEKEKERLAKLYGQDRFAQAVKYAGIVYKDNDTQVIEDIIKKMETYGASEVGKAFGKISYREADNPKRSYRYVIGILQAEAKREIDGEKMDHSQ
ncbi:MAG: phospholipase D-like domain-containing protein [Candidatus Omnitrophica bacterium]|nr:phospholipase D-like domain-containing protein [Candidatus Omnitrophota bacterium]